MGRLSLGQKSSLWQHELARVPLRCEPRAPRLRRREARWWRRAFPADTRTQAQPHAPSPLHGVDTAQGTQAHRSVCLPVPRAFHPDGSLRSPLLPLVHHLRPFVQHREVDYDDVPVPRHPHLHPVWLRGRLLSTLHEPDRPILQAPQSEQGHPPEHVPHGCVPGRGAHFL